jgi:hypothetical protein
MHAYIEIVTAELPAYRRGTEAIAGDRWMTRLELTDSDLRDIGKFTRENVLRLVEHKRNTDVGWNESLCWGIWDVHAVCGNVDIPWATEAARAAWETASQKRNKVGP